MQTRALKRNSQLTSLKICFIYSLTQQKTIRKHYTQYLSNKYIFNNHYQLFVILGGKKYSKQRQTTRFAFSMLEVLRSSSPTMYISGQASFSICKNTRCHSGVNLLSFMQKNNMHINVKHFKYVCAFVCMYVFVQSVCCGRLQGGPRC